LGLRYGAIYIGIGIRCGRHVGECALARVIQPLLWL
jgi:hypothetical protein